MANANLSYKMPNTSKKKTKLMSLKFFLFFTIFSVHSKIVYIYTSIHRCNREDNWFKSNKLFI